MSTAFSQKQKDLLGQGSVLVSSNDVFPQVDFFQHNGLTEIPERNVVPPAL